jgi:hypothetical protein
VIENHSKFEVRIVVRFLQAEGVSQSEIHYRLLGQTFTENIQKAIDRRLHAIELLFDLSKAFNMINHDILLGKLISCGINGEAKFVVQVMFVKATPIC